MYNDALVREDGLSFSRKVVDSLRKLMLKAEGLVDRPTLLVVPSDHPSCVDALMAGTVGRPLAGPLPKRGQCEKDK